MNFSANLSNNGGLAEPPETPQLEMIKYWSFLVIGIVGAVVCTAVYFPMVAHRRLSKQDTLFGGFLFSCWVDALSTCHDCVRSLSLYFSPAAETSTLSSRQCLLHSVYNLEFVFSQDAIALLLLATSFGRYLALRRPILYYRMTITTYQYIMATVYAFSFAHVMTIVIWVSVVARKELVSPYCLPSDFMPTFMHEMNICVITSINLLTVAVYAVSVVLTKSRMQQLAENSVSRVNVRRELVATKRLCIAAVHITLMHVIPALCQLSFCKSSAIRPYLTFLWLPYNISLILCVVSYCAWQSTVRNLIVPFWTCKRNQ